MATKLKESIVYMNDKEYNYWMKKIYGNKENSPKNKYAEATAKRVKALNWNNVELR